MYYSRGCVLLRPEAPVSPVKFLLLRPEGNLAVALLLPTNYYSP